MEPWFELNDSQLGLIGGIAGGTFGLIGGILGAFAGYCVPKGKAKSFILGSLLTLTTICFISLIVGIVAYFQNQPYGIWYGFGLFGLIGTTVIGGNYFVVRKRYQEFKLRNISASDLGG